MSWHLASRPRPGRSSRPPQCATIRAPGSRWRSAPIEYPLTGEVSNYLSNELGFGRLLDYGVIVPRLQQLYEWSAHELGAPGLLDCTRDGALTYAWPFEERDVWRPRGSFVLRMAHRALPPPRGPTVTAGGARDS